MKMLKIGFDLHGVLDKDPEIFSIITDRLRKDGHEVHILTGQEITKNLLEDLKSLKISWDKIFSITSYHKTIGTYIKYKNGDPSQPLIAPPKWDRTKADYAEKAELDIHIDDSKIYGEYFINSTQYLLYNSAIRTFLLLLIG